MPTEAVQVYKPDSVTQPYSRGSYHLSGIAVTNDLYRPTRDSITPPESETTETSRPYSAAYLVFQPIRFIWPRRSPAGR